MLLKTLEFSLWPRKFCQSSASPILLIPVIQVIPCYLGKYLGKKVVVEIVCATRRDMFAAIGTEAKPGTQIGRSTGHGRPYRNVP